jgi:predicted transcriptional regulator
MMRKKQITAKLDNDMLEYVDILARRTGIAKSNIPEFALRVLQTYFTDKQLEMEAVVHAPKDGRRKENKEDF